MVEGLVKVGKLLRLHGTSGALLLQLDKKSSFHFSKTKVLFVRINGTPTPFFPSQVSEHGTNAIVSFDTVVDIKEAQRLIGKEVLIEPKLLRKEKKQEDFVGYTLHDAKRGKLGVVQELMEMPGQYMFAIEIAGKEVLLPANEELITKIDRKNKTIYYTSPEGLIDIYLE